MDISVYNDNAFAMKPSGGVHFQQQIKQKDYNSGKESNVKSQGPKRRALGDISNGMTRNALGDIKNQVSNGVMSTMKEKTTMKSSATTTTARKIIQMKDEFAVDDIICSSRSACEMRDDIENSIPSMLTYIHDYGNDVENKQAKSSRKSKVNGNDGGKTLTSNSRTPFRSIINVSNTPSADITKSKLIQKQAEFNMHMKEQDNHSERMDSKFQDSFMEDQPIAELDIDMDIDFNL